MRCYCFILNIVEKIKLVYFLMLIIKSRSRTRLHMPENRTKSATLHKPLPIRKNAFVSALSSISRTTKSDRVPKLRTFARASVMVPPSNEIIHSTKIQTRSHANSEKIAKRISKSKIAPPSTANKSRVSKMIFI